MHQEENTQTTHVSFFSFSSLKIRDSLLLYKVARNNISLKLMLLVQKKMKPKETDIGLIQKLHSLRVYLEVKEANVWNLIISGIWIRGKAWWIKIPDACWKALMENSIERAWEKVSICESQHLEEGLAVCKWKWKESESCSVMSDSLRPHGLILEWVVFPFSRGSSQPRDRT